MASLSWRAPPPLRHTGTLLPKCLARACIQGWLGCTVRRGSKAISPWSAFCSWLFLNVTGGQAADHGSLSSSTSAPSLCLGEATFRPMSAFCLLPIHECSTRAEALADSFATVETLSTALAKGECCACFACCACCAARSLVRAGLAAVADSTARCWLQRHVVKGLPVSALPVTGCCGM